MLSECLRVSIPLSGVRVDCNDASLYIMDIIAQMLMKSHGNRSIYFVVHKHSELHRNIAVLLGGQGIALGSELSQTATDAESGVTRLDHVIDIAILGCLIRISEELVVLILLLGDECPP